MRKEYRIPVKVSSTLYRECDTTYLFAKTIDFFTKTGSCIGGLRVYVDHESYKKEWFNIRSLPPPFGEGSTAVEKYEVQRIVKDKEQYFVAFFDKDYNLIKRK